MKCSSGSILLIANLNIILKTILLLSFSYIYTECPRNPYSIKGVFFLEHLYIRYHNQIKYTHAYIFMHSFRYESIDSKSDYVLQLCTYILSYSVYVMLATGFIQVKLHYPCVRPHPHPSLPHPPHHRPGCQSKHNPFVMRYSVCFFSEFCT